MGYAADRPVRGGSFSDSVAAGGIALIHRRRRDDPDGPMPHEARWPLEIEPDFRSFTRRDPFVDIVRETVVSYADGFADRASRHWHDDIVWRVPGSRPPSGEHVGPDAIFAYHRELERLTDGTFRQRMLSLEGSQGPLIEAYLRTTATRGERQLDIPTLMVFELQFGHIRVVSELPGDQAAWDDFWVD
jgi:ketosteroid isomerase-like protein